MQNEINPRTGISPWKVVTAGISVVVLLGAVLSFLFFFKKDLSRKDGRPDNKTEVNRPSDDPRQQLAFESGELFKETKQSQIKELETYAWLDDQHRFARIPISRALEIYLQIQAAMEIKKGASK